MNWKTWLKGTFLAGALAGCLALGASAASIGVGTVEGDGLRLRTEPSLSGKILTEAFKGDQVIVLEDAKGWYKVDFGTRMGYMSAGYVTVSTDVEADLGLGMVTTSGGCLNLRAGVGTDTEQLDSIQPRSIVSILGFKDGWYKITYGENTGYVSSDYITLVQDQDGKRADGSTAEPTATQLGQAIVAEAMKHLGKAYVGGGAGPNSFDCCGFTQYVYKQVTGKKMPRTCDGQLTNGPGTRVDCAIENCQPGDLLFICKPSARGKVLSSHVAICLGDCKIIHASSPQTGVIITDMKTTGHYFRDYVGVRRLG